MSRRPIEIQISSEDQNELRQLLRAGIQQVRVVLRALALEQLSHGATAPTVARIVHLTPQAVRRIGHRYQRGGLEGLRRPTRDALSGAGASGAAGTGGAGSEQPGAALPYGGGAGGKDSRRSISIQRVFDLDPPSRGVERIPDKEDVAAGADRAYGCV